MDPVIYIRRSGGCMERKCDEGIRSRGGRI